VAQLNPVAHFLVPDSQTKSEKFFADFQEEFVI